jgi:hypothetical protein
VELAAVQVTRWFKSQDAPSLCLSAESFYPTRLQGATNGEEFASRLMARVNEIKQAGGTASVPIEWNKFCQGYFLPLNM